MLGKLPHAATGSASATTSSSRTGRLRSEMDDALRHNIGCEEPPRAPRPRPIYLKNNAYGTVYANNRPGIWRFCLRNVGAEGRSHKAGRQVGMAADRAA